MFQQIKRYGLLYRLWFYLERRAKEGALDCHMCGQCIARSTALTCSMQCPKQLRNGPCGGSMDGHCEVYPERRCIWTQIYTRADRFGWMKRKLAAIQPAVDWSLFGSSAWLNMATKKIDADGHAASAAPVPSGNLWEQKKGVPAGCCSPEACACCPNAAAEGRVAQPPSAASSTQPRATAPQQTISAQPGAAVPQKTFDIKTPDQKNPDQNTSREAAR